jgi:hypothetical protein
MCVVLPLAVILNVVQNTLQSGAGRSTFVDDAIFYFDADVGCPLPT